jgi:predicted secreted hydrolase
MPRHPGVSKVSNLTPCELPPRSGANLGSPGRGVPVRAAGSCRCAPPWTRPFASLSSAMQRHGSSWSRSARDRIVCRDSQAGTASLRSLRSAPWGPPASRHPLAHPVRRFEFHHGGLPDSGSVWRIAAAVAAGIAGILLLLAPPGASAVGQWAAAEGTRAWTFPRDHGSHPEYRTEWWYFTGILAAADGRRFGYQLTFFRQGIVPVAADPANPWSVRDLHLAHFSLTDVSAGTFRYAERVSRAGPGLAGADAGALRAWVLDWAAAAGGEIFTLTAREGAVAIRLALRPRSHPVLHGVGGLSLKGPAAGQASWYASVTDLETAGTVRTADGGEIEVRGASWFDHEFGSGQLGDDLAGWDWFGLRLSDGRALMVYRLRRRDGTAAPESSGTLVGADGTARHLSRDEVAIEPLATWQSPNSRARYPARWRVLVPAARLALELSPLLEDQELRTGKSTGVTYWEGAVGGGGTAGGFPVAVEGYAELTGYAGGLGGLF